MIESVSRDQGMQPTSPLLSLPPELRNRIWEYLFSSVADKNGILRDEAQGIFYHINHLELKLVDSSGPEPMAWETLLSPIEFLESVSPGRRNAIRTLTCVILELEMTAVVLKRCRRLPRLTCLRLRLMQPIHHLAVEREVMFDREWYFIKKALRGLSRIRDFRLLPPPSAGAGVKTSVEKWEARIRVELGLLALH
ncbi:hypothetical protein LTR85_005426 [Meristemomyces frigidus]|nr:hypothetical protein LTR85_005426 [Meristemomyces frigidus]